MKRHRYLCTLGRSAKRKIRRLRSEAQSTSAGWGILSAADRERSAAHLSIGLLNMWSNFSRSYFVSAFCGARLSRGRLVEGPIGTDDFNQAIGFAVVENNPRERPRSNGLWHRRSEPTWHDKNFFIRVTAAADLSVALTVSAALSAGQKVFDDLPVFRNYYAHRNHQTLLAAQSLAPRYGYGIQQKPSSILLEMPMHRSSCIMEDWLLDVEITIEFLCDK